MALIFRPFNDPAGRAYPHANRSFVFTQTTKRFLPKLNQICHKNPFVFTEEERKQNLPKLVTKKVYLNFLPSYSNSKKVLPKLNRFVRTLKIPILLFVSQK